MMDKHLRNTPMRDELRRIIIPLLHKCMNENPKDLICFCSRYFQSLLDDRNSSGLSENQESNSSEERLKSMCEESTVKRSALQGSSSLPILNEDISTKGLQLRETTSWNDSSSIRQTPTQAQKVHFSVTDPVMQIGDQLSMTDGWIGVEIGKNIGEGCKTEVVATSILKADKNEGNSDVPENNDKSTEIINVGMPPYSINEFEKEFDKLMNMAEVSFHPQTPASTRKKWKFEADANWQLDGKLQLPDRDIVDSDDAADSHILKEERDKVTKSSKDASAENMLLDASFGFIPKLDTDLEKMEISRNVERDPDMGDIEGLVKSVSHALQALIHVLCESRLYFDHKLEKVKQIKGGRGGPKVDEKPQIPLRKKRSVTTFSVSDTKPHNRNNNSKPNKEEYKDMENCVEEMHSLEEDVRGKVDKSLKSMKYLKDESINNENGISKSKKDSNDANQKLSTISGDVEENVQMEHGKEICPAKYQVKKNDDASIKAQTQTYKFDEKDTVYVNRSEQCKSKPHRRDASEYKAGMSSEIELPDENIQRRPWGKRRNLNQNDHDGRSNFQFENRHQQHPRQPRCPNDCKSYNVSSHGTSTKRRGRSFNNRPPRFRGFRGEQISTRQRTGSSNVLEGGDVLQATISTQRSVGTETEFSQVRERSGNSNATSKLETNSSSFNGNVVSGNVDGHCIKFNEKNFEGNQTNKKYAASSVKGNAGGSVCQRKEPKILKSIDRSPKSTGKPSDMSSTFIDRPIEKPEPKSDTPKQNLLKDVPDSKKQNVQLESKSVINVSRPISNSSLNPAAKSFNPSNFMKTKGNINSPVKSPGNQTFSGRERYTIDMTDTLSQSKDSELSGKKTYGFTTDWAIENSENDFTSEDNGVSNNLNALNIENGHSHVKSNAISHGFNSRTHESDKETVIPNSITNGSANENVFQRRMNAAFKNDEQSPNEKNNKKPCSHSDLKTDVAAYCNDEPEQEHENHSSTQGCGMRSACGDFLVIDAGTQPPSELQEGVNPRPNADLQVRPSRSMVDAQDQNISGSQNLASKEEPGLSSAGGDFGPIEEGPIEDIAQPLLDVLEGIIQRSNPPPNRDVSGLTQAIGNRPADRIEDIELNFACLSGSETSELYSDLSDEYSYEENNVEQDL